MLFNSLHFLIFFSDCCRDILSDTAESQVILASFGKLLFLYVLERKVCGFASILYNCDICDRDFAGKMRPWG